MGCYNDDVLFIHIPKCAGWSVKNYLKDHLPDILMPDDPRAKLPIGHVPLRDIERFSGRPPDSFKLILAVIRNPYEQQLSQWSFWRDRFARGQRHVHDVTAARCADLTSWLHDPGCDFHLWYEQHHGYKPGMTPEQQTQANTEGGTTDQRYENFGGYFRYWLEVDGTIPDNLKVLKAEDLNETLPATIEQYATEKLGDVATLNTSEHGSKTQEYYTPIAARIVEDKFKWAFENHYTRWQYSSIQ